ncbi:MAG: DM13 domain-containing protein [Cyanobacteria bacterium P01_C01_bin.120]
MKRFVLATLSAATLGLTLASGASALKPLEFSALTQTGSATEAVTLAQATTGQFVTVDQAKATTGTASVVTEDGQTYLVFDEAFSTANGPDVTVVLYADGAAVPVNIEGSDYVVLEALQSFEGGQRYLVDASLDINDYDAVAIWCREFDVTFGYAPL